MEKKKFFLEKLWKDYKWLKLKEKAKSGDITINNHVDSDNFEDNFNGIRDLFVKLLGPWLNLKKLKILFFFYFNIFLYERW